MWCVNNESNESWSVLHLSPLCTIPNAKNKLEFIFTNHIFHFIGLCIYCHVTHNHSHNILCCFFLSFSLFWIFIIVIRRIVCTSHLVCSIFMFIENSSSFSNEGLIHIVCVRLLKHAFSHSNLDVNNKAKYFCFFFFINLNLNRNLVTRRYTTANSTRISKRSGSF